MKSLAHRLWFLLFAGIGTALLALLLLLYGTGPMITVWAIPLRYTLLGPAIAGAYLFAGVVALADALTGPVDSRYLISLESRVFSRASLFWAVAKISLSLVLLAGADLLWLVITVYYSAGSHYDRLNAFADRFGTLLGAVNLLLVVKVFVVYAYGTRVRRWQVAVAEGLASLAMAGVLGAIMLLSPFDGVMPYALALLLKAIVGAFFFFQALDAISRLSRAIEFWSVEHEPQVAEVVIQ